jgi:hypothetical protein
MTVPPMLHGWQNHSQTSLLRLAVKLGFVSAWSGQRALSLEPLAVIFGV